MTIAAAGLMTMMMAALVWNGPEGVVTAAGGRHESASPVVAPAPGHAAASGSVAAPRQAAAPTRKGKPDKPDKADKADKARKPAADASLAGVWRGTLDAGGQKLRLVVNVKAGKGGKLTATMDSLDQGARDLPIENVKVVGDKVTFDMPMVQGNYSGTRRDADTIEGTWKQGPAALPLKLTRSK